MKTMMRHWTLLLHLKFLILAESVTTDWSTVSRAPSQIDEQNSRGNYANTHHLAVVNHRFHVGTASPQEHDNPSLPSSLPRAAVQIQFVDATRPLLASQHTLGNHTTQKDRGIGGGQHEISINAPSGETGRDGGSRNYNEPTQQQPNRTISVGSAGGAVTSLLHFNALSEKKESRSRNNQNIEKQPAHQMLSNVGAGPDVLPQKLLRADNEKEEAFSRSRASSDSSDDTTYSRTPSLGARLYHWLAPPPQTSGDVIIRFPDGSEFRTPWLPPPPPPPPPPLQRKFCLGAANHSHETQPQLLSGARAAAAMRRESQLVSSQSRSDFAVANDPHEKALITRVKNATHRAMTPFWVHRAKIKGDLAAFGRILAVIGIARSTAWWGWRLSVWALVSVAVGTVAYFSVAYVFAKELPIRMMMRTKLSKQRGMRQNEGKDHAAIR